MEPRRLGAGNHDPVPDDHNSQRCRGEDETESSAVGEEERGRGESPLTGGGGSRGTVGNTRLHNSGTTTRASDSQTDRQTQQWACGELDRPRPLTATSDKPTNEEMRRYFLGIPNTPWLRGDHVHSICSKLTSGNCSLRNLSKYCPARVPTKAYYGLTHPHLTYGIYLLFLSFKTWFFCHVNE